MVSASSVTQPAIENCGPICLADNEAARTMNGGFRGLVVIIWCIPGAVTCASSHTHYVSHVIAEHGNDSPVTSRSRSTFDVNLIC